MTLSMHSLAIETFVPMLRTLAQLLEKAERQATTKNLDPVSLVDARLFPDMLPLVRQVQIACDTARRGTARLVGREAAAVEDSEKSLEQLRARIAATVEGLQATPASAFEGAENRDIRLPLRDGLVLEMKGYPHLRDWLLPNFYFHVVTAYDILRHHGIEIGKSDFMSHTASSIHPA